MRTYKRWPNWLIAVLGLGSTTAFASTAAVPDRYGTVQAAIDAGVDTVLIREGSYPETPSAYRGVTLLGAGDKRPKLQGLAISNPYEWLSLSWSVARIDFTDPVTISTNNVNGRGINVDFTDCALDAGLQHVLTEDIYDIGLLSLTRCRLPATCAGRMAGLTMQSDTVDVGVKWTVNGNLSVRDCWFRGGTGRALDIDGDVFGGEIASSLFEGYSVAIRATSLDGHDPVGFAIDSNVIRRMTVAAMYVGCNSGTFRNNHVVDCSEGVVVELNSRLQLYGNTILRCGQYGLWLTSADVLLADGNTVGYCGGDGIALAPSGYSDIRITHNTLIENAGSGIDLQAGGVMNNVVVQGNVACWNRGYGIAVQSTQDRVALGCNDWFGNVLGPVNGTASSADDRELDPLFCNVEMDDVGLFSDSPLLAQLACGQIGARGIGCTLPVLKSLAVRSIQAGLQVEWAFDSTSVVQSWIERAVQSAGPWDSLGTTTSTTDDRFALIDREVAPDRAYYYRVAWKQRGAIQYGTAVIGSWVDAGRLSSVSPNPAIGEVTVDWVLSRPGTTDVRVYDLAGREISVVVRGSFDVGRHQARWDGRWDGRGVAPAGMYIVRIVSGERTTSHRVLLLR